MLQTESDKIINYLYLDEDFITGKDLTVNFISKGDKFHISPIWYFSKSTDKFLFEDAIKQEVIINNVICDYSDLFEIEKISKKEQFIRVKLLNRNIEFNIIDFSNRPESNSTFNSSTVGLIFF